MKITAAQIDALLPQTQCGDCGYPGCMPYAMAIEKGEVDINLCPPGGERGLRRLAAFIGKSADSYLVDFVSKPTTVAVIDETRCIGCVKCIAVCPVDAIVGSQKLMHTVITDNCTGCNLCVEPCPMDCISLRAISLPSEAEQEKRSGNYRARFYARKMRLAKKNAEYIEQYQKAISRDPRAAIAAALARKNHE